MSMVSEKKSIKHKIWAWAFLRILVIVLCVALDS